MRHDCRGATLGTESISGGGGCCERCAKNLDGHVAAKRLIGGAKDECGCPLANQLLQPVAASNDVAGLERSLVTR